MDTWGHSGTQPEVATEARGRAGGTGGHLEDVRGHLGTLGDTHHEVLLGAQLGLQLRPEDGDLPVVAAVALGTTRGVTRPCHPTAGPPPGTTKPPVGDTHP